MTTTLPASGPISIRDFNLGMEGALGFSAGRNTSLNDPAVRANTKKKTGPVSLGDLRGKTVTRTNKPLAVAPNMDGVDYFGQPTIVGAGTYATIWFKITPDGTITVATSNGATVGAIATTQYTGNIAAAVGVNHLWQTDITVEYISSASGANHSTTVSDLSADPSWGSLTAWVTRAHATGLASSTYRVTITDKYDASNSLVFTFTLALTPVWD